MAGTRTKKAGRGWRWRWRADNNPLTFPYREKRRLTFDLRRERATVRALLSSRWTCAWGACMEATLMGYSGDQDGQIGLKSAFCLGPGDKVWMVRYTLGAQQVRICKESDIP